LALNRWRTWDCIILLRRALLALDRLGRALQLPLHNGHLPLQNGNVSAGLGRSALQGLGFSFDLSTGNSGDSAFKTLAMFGMSSILPRP
jgi:hypothetical protein